MQIEIRTTITSRINIGDDGIEGADHDVRIDGGPGAEALPENVILATVAGACKSVIKSLDEASSD